MILFLDTETTGLPDFNKRARDPEQPHIVQLAAMLTDDAGKVFESHNVIVQPDGWQIPKEASDVHGITNELAKDGLAEEQVAGLLLMMIKRARVIVAHNLQFDKFLARIAMRRFELIEDADDEWWKGIPGFCTMREMTSICRLDSPGRKCYKYPKLTEAYRHITGNDLNGSHDALNDVIACKEIYFWLQKQKEILKKGIL